MLDSDGVSSLPDDGIVSRSPCNSMMLYSIAIGCEGMSGRALRKLPFLAHASNASSAVGALPIGDFLVALMNTVVNEMAARHELAPPMKG